MVEVGEAAAMLDSVAGSGATKSAPMQAVQEMDPVAGWVVVAAA